MSTEPTTVVSEVTPPIAPKLVIPDNSIVYITGFSTCRNYVRAVETYRLLNASQPGTLRVAKFESDRDGFHAYRPTVLQELGMEETAHKTSPLIVLLDPATMKPTTYIGGGSDFCDIIKSQYDVEPAVLGPRLD